MLFSRTVPDDLYGGRKALLFRSSSSNNFLGKSIEWLGVMVFGLSRLAVSYTGSRQRRTRYASEAHLSRSKNAVDQVHGVAPKLPLASLDGRKHLQATCYHFPGKEMP